jgi:hypothetical protein
MSSPRHKWMERFSVATTAEALGNGTWFETSSSSTYVRNDGVSVSSCPAEVLAPLCARFSLRAKISASRPLRPRGVGPILAPPLSPLTCPPLP